MVLDQPFGSAADARAWRYTAATRPPPACTGWPSLGEGVRRPLPRPPTGNRHGVAAATSRRSRPDRARRRYSRRWPVADSERWLGKWSAVDQDRAGHGYGRPRVRDQFTSPFWSPPRWAATSTVLARPRRTARRPRTPRNGLRPRHCRTAGSSRRTNHRNRAPGSRSASLGRTGPGHWMTRGPAPTTPGPSRPGRQRCRTGAHPDATSHAAHFRACCRRPRGVRRGLRRRAGGGIALVDHDGPVPARATRSHPPAGRASRASPPRRRRRATPLARCVSGTPPVHERRRCPRRHPTAPARAPSPAAPPHRLRWRTASFGKHRGRPPPTVPELKTRPVRAQAARLGPVDSDPRFPVQGSTSSSRRAPTAVQRVPPSGASRRAPGSSGTPSAEGDGRATPAAALPRATPRARPGRRPRHQPPGHARHPGREPHELHGLRGPTGGRSVHAAFGSAFPDT